LIDYSGGKIKVNPEPAVENNAWSQVAAYGETIHWGAIDESSAAAT